MQGLLVNGCNLVLSTRRQIEDYQVSDLGIETVKEGSILAIDLQRGYWREAAVESKDRIFDIPSGVN